MARDRGGHAGKTARHGIRMCEIKQEKRERGRFLTITSEGEVLF